MEQNKPGWFSMESRNPAFGEKALRRGFSVDAAESGTMTVDGTVNKTGVLLVLLVMSSALSWQVANSPLGHFLAIAGVISSLGVFFAMLYRPQASAYLAPAYAILEGFAIGAISCWYSTAQPGIVSNAIALTFGALAGMLLLYRFGFVRATERFKAGMAIALVSILFVYLADLVMGMFGTRVPFLHESSPLGIGISGVICVVAALSFVIDFDRIERLAAGRAPKHMEWYAAFSLIVTIVWLYLELLRLLSKLSRR